MLFMALNVARVEVDPDTAQTVLSGMGELHLEIIKDRIQKEYKVDVDLGPLMISYRESIQSSVTETASVDKTIGECCTVPYLATAPVTTRGFYFLHKQLCV